MWEMWEVEGYPNPILWTLEKASLAAGPTSDLGESLAQARSGVELSCRLKSGGAKFVRYKFVITGELTGAYALGWVNRKSLTLLSVFVPVADRCHGQGRRLVEDLVRAAAAEYPRLNVAFVDLQCCLAGARGFWEKLGFVVSGEAEGRQHASRAISRPSLNEADSAPAPVGGEVALDSSVAEKRLEAAEELVDGADYEAEDAGGEAAEEESSQGEEESSQGEEDNSEEESEKEEETVSAKLRLAAAEEELSAALQRRIVSDNEEATVAAKECVEAAREKVRAAKRILKVEANLQFNVASTSDVLASRQRRGDWGQQDEAVAREVGTKRHQRPQRLVDAPLPKQTANSGRDPMLNEIAATEAVCAALAAQAVARAAEEQETAISVLSSPQPRSACSDVEMLVDGVPYHWIKKEPIDFYSGADYEAEDAGVEAAEQEESSQGGQEESSQGGQEDSSEDVAVESEEEEETVLPTVGSVIEVEFDAGTAGPHGWYRGTVAGVAWDARDARVAWDTGEIGLLRLLGVEAQRWRLVAKSPPKELSRRRSGAKDIELEQASGSKPKKKSRELDQLRMFGWDNKPETIGTAYAVPASEKRPRIETNRMVPVQWQQTKRRRRDGNQIRMAGAVLESDGAQQAKVDEVLNGLGLMPAAKQASSIDIDGAKKIVDLFSGIGAFADSADRNQAEVALFAEIDVQAQAMYLKTGWADETKALGDVNAIKASVIKSSGAAIGTAGFPCQSNSSTGNKLGIEDGPTKQIFVSLVSLIRMSGLPAWLLENVPGIKDRMYQGVSQLQLLFGALEGAGYHPVAHRINSKYAGVAQTRDRFYFAVFCDEAVKGRYLRSLDDIESPLRKALRDRITGVNQIIEPGITSKTDPDLYVKGWNESWRRGKMYVLSEDSTLPAHCLTARDSGKGYNSTYFYTGLKADLGKGKDHDGKLEFDDYKHCPEKIRLASDKEIHKLMSLSRQVLQ